MSSRREARAGATRPATADVISASTPEIADTARSRPTRSMATGAIPNSRRNRRRPPLTASAVPPENKMSVDTDRSTRARRVLCRVAPAGTTRRAQHTTSAPPVAAT